MKVYLDDERDAPSGWIRVYTPQEAIGLLKYGLVKEISLDHDLGDDVGIGTGYDVILWLEERIRNGTQRFPKIRIHTANPAARERMLAAVKSIELYVKNEMN